MKNRKNLFYISMFAICVLVLLPVAMMRLTMFMEIRIIECTFWIIPRSIR